MLSVKFLKTWPLYIIWIIIITFVSLICTFLPLTNTLGYEFAFVISVIASLGAGHIASLYPSRIRAQKAPFPGSDKTAVKLFFHTLRLTSLLVIIPLAINLLNGLRVPQCNIHDGLLFYTLMPVISLIFATTAGLFAGLFTPWRVVSALLFFALWTGTLAYSVYQVYTTPAVFVFNHFWGYFPGVFYDTQISITNTIIIYQIYTLTIALAVFIFINSFLNSTSLTLSFNKKAFSIKNIIIYILTGLSVTLFFINSSNLGFNTTAQKLKQQLSKKITFDNIELFFDPSINNSVALKYSKDIKFSLYRINSILNIKNSPKTQYNLFIFKNSSQKKAVMGAGVSLAKPWLGDAYVTINKTPDFTARHELVHLVAANFSKGLLKLSGKLYGLIPDPPIIEGLAMAVAQTDDPLDLHHQARAMLDLNILPSISKMSGFGFFKEFAPKAYTAAGSFYLFILQTKGADTLKKLYQGISAKDATGKDTARLESEWRKYLSTLSMSDNEIAMARFKFDRPSIIATPCVHEVQKTNRLAQNKYASGNCTQYIHLLRKNCKAPCSARQEFLLFTAYVKCKDNDMAKAVAKDLLKKNPGLVRTLYIQEILTDSSSLNDKQKSAEYLKLYKQAALPHVKRRLYIKHYLTSKSGWLPSQLTKSLYLIQKNNNSTLTTLQIFKYYMENPDDIFAAYLAARQFILNGDSVSGINILKKAWDNGLKDAPASILTESEFMLGRAYYTLKKQSEAKLWFKKIEQSPLALSGQKQLAHDWIIRTSYSKNPK